MTPPTSKTTMRGPLVSSASLKEPGPSVCRFVTRMIFPPRPPGVAAAQPSAERPSAAVPAAVPVLTPVSVPASAPTTEVTMPAPTAAPVFPGPPTTPAIPPEDPRAAEVANLEAQIASDRERLRQIISTKRWESAELASDPNIREIAERLPRLQAELAALRAETVP